MSETQAIRGVVHAKVGEVCNLTRASTASRRSGTGVSPVAAVRTLATGTAATAALRRTIPPPPAILPREIANLAYFVRLTR